MKQEEMMFVMEVCKGNYTEPKLLHAYLEEGADTPAVLGYLLYHRMAGVAFSALQQNNMLQRLNRESRTALNNTWLQNVEKNKSYFQCLQQLNKVLKDCQGKYAMLKGAYLCNWYPAGYRTANDVDLLVAPNDVTLIGEALQKAGFRQGEVKNGQFVPATRQEIIASRIMRGETVPYIKQVDLPFFKYLEVDINFSLDYKPGQEETISKWLANAGKTMVDGMAITTLAPRDFFLHLCQHLYKEATTYPWVKMKRDMTLYKFFDIYTLIQEWDKEDWQRLAEDAEALGMQIPCYYALYTTAELYGLRSLHLARCLEQLEPKDKGFLHQVISPSEKKTYQYITKDITERFFSPDRTQLLKEVAL